MSGSGNDNDPKRVAELAAPFGQRIELFDVSPEEGVRLMRVRIRERSRFTVPKLQRWPSPTTPGPKPANDEGGNDEGGNDD